MHIRRTYLALFKEQLKSTSVFSGKVFNQRIPPKNVYPSAIVYALSESVAAITMQPSPRSQERTLTFNVGIFIKATQDDEKLEADIDKYTSLIEAAIQEPANVIDLQLIEVSFPQIFQDDEKLEIYEVVMTYSLRYTTTEFNPV